MKITKLLLVGVFGLLVFHVDGAKILAVLPLPAISHNNFFKPILNELANRGHDLTVITMLPEKGAKYNQIVIDSSALASPHETFNFFEMRNSYWFFGFLGLFYFSQTVAGMMFQSPEVQKLVHSTDLHFDVVITESTFMQEAYVAFGHKFQAPVIELHSVCTGFWFNHLTANPSTYSYIVDYKTRSSNKMNFYERLQNTLIGISTLIFHDLFLMPKQEKMMNEYLNYTGWEGRPPIREMLAKTSLALVNTHEALHYAQPNNPNIIYVGGLHVRPPKKLPEDLQTYLDEAKEGVIYFSMGSNIRSAMMPDETKQALLKAFGKLPYKFLWKFETESLPNKPSNLKISKWFPQTDILAHPNVKAFMTHGGFMSMTESVYNKVPMIVIPIYGDQDKNSKQAETVGFGVPLLFDNITEESVMSAVNEVVKPIYKEAVIRQSNILQDNPLPPMDKAMYWIDYVIRHKGAPHLLTAAIDLPWYQYFLLDVLAVFLAVVIVTLGIIYLLLKALFRRVFAKKVISAKKKKN